MPPSAFDSRTPAAVLAGGADMAFSPVERDVSPDEVKTAVERVVGATTICMNWPSLWLDQMTVRTVFRALLGRMRSDWGAEVATSGEQRMDEFVDMGFLTKTPRPEAGEGVVDYELTDLGRSYLRGSPYGDGRPEFCAPTQRRVIEITNMEWGQFPCGSLQVHFTHEAPQFPTWAHTDAARARVAQLTDAPQHGAGTVTLSRTWYSRQALPFGARNGALQSVCLDPNRQQAIGDDLNLSVAETTEATAPREATQP